MRDGMVVARRVDLPAEATREVQRRTHVGDDDVQLRERQRPVHPTIVATHIGLGNNDDSDDSRRGLGFLDVLLSRTVDQVP